jgi:hypothetical protein
MCAALCAIYGSSHATILTFGGLNLSNYGEISSSYGDRVTDTGSAPTGTYEQGNGWTASIVTDYQAVDTNGVVYDDNLLYWDTGYGDLSDVAFVPVSGTYARIILTADAGMLVRLNSFDLGGYPGSDLEADSITVKDGNGNVLWSASDLTVIGSGGHSTYTPNLVANQLVLEWGTNWNIAIDNVNFDEADVVPEPATLALLGLGLAAIAKRRRR